jgi:hypothetical protein
MTYSDGKLDLTDEGDLEVSSYIEKGRLILNFNKQISWFGFDLKSLRYFIDGLEDQYKKLLKEHDERR